MAMLLFVTVAAATINVRQLFDRRAAGYPPVEPPAAAPLSATPGRPAFTVIIPSWNGRALLERCLPPLLAEVERCAADGHGRGEVVVVDDASTDDTRAFLARQHPAVRTLALPKRGGFGAACNAGVAGSAADIVVLLNNDMIVERGFLPPLLEPFGDPSIFAVAAQIYFQDPGKRREETGLTSAQWRDGFVEPRHEPPPASPELRTTFWAGGGSSAFDRRKWLALGGFSPILRPFYVEDVDLSYRAWKRGWKVVFQPRSIVHHHHRATIGAIRSPAEIDRIVRKNTLRFLWTNLRLRTLLTQHFPALLAADGDRAAAAAVVPELLVETLRAPRLFWRARATAQRGVRVTDADVFGRVTNGPVDLDGARTPDGPLNILIVSAYVPYPPLHGGAVRVYNLVKGLAQRHRVTLLAFYEREGEDLAAAPLHDLCEVVLVHRRPRARSASPWRMRLKDYEAFDADEMHDAVQRLVGSRRPDVIHYSWTQMAPYLDHARAHGAVTVLEEHDIAFLSYRRQVRQQLASGPVSLRERAGLWFEYLQRKDFELAACNGVDLVVAMSAHDRAVLQPYLRPPIWVVPNAADTQALEQPSGTVRDRQALLFVGSFRHPPNNEGLHWFCRAVWPAIREAIPGARLRVVGSYPPPEIEALGQLAGVELLGTVEDVRPYFWTSGTLIAPIFRGSGTRVKILEAFAAGLPVVSTPLGVEGLEVVDGRHCLLASSVVAWTDAIARLYHDPERAEGLATAAQQLARERYDWAISAATLERAYREGRRAKGAT